jgi:hypothetical protein
VILLLGGDESAGGRFPDEVPVTFIFLSPFDFLADANGALRHALFNTIYLKSLQNVCIVYSEPVKTT